jgi:hypothetical protein
MGLALTIIYAWWYRAMGYGLWYVLGDMLKELVMLMVLVWSMVYVLYKILICSKFNYLGLVDTMISKGDKWPRIALKCVKH